MKRTLKYLYAIRDKLRETVLVDPEEIADKLVFFHDKNGLIHFPVNTSGQIPTIALPFESELILYKRKCTNDGANAGNQGVKIEPAADSIVMLYFCSLLNGDVAGRAGAFRLSTAGANVIGFLNSATVGAGAYIVYPRGTGAANHFEMKNALMLTDELELESRVDAVAVSQDSSHFMLYSVIGDDPVITETGPTDSVWSDVS